MDLTHNQSLAKKSKKVKCGSNRDIPPDLQSAIHSTVYSGPKVPKEIANHLGLSTKRLLNYCTDKPFKFSSRHLLPLMQFTQNYAPLEFLCSKTGHNLFNVGPNKSSEGIIPLALEFDKTYQDLESNLNFYFRNGLRDKETLREIDEDLFKLINTTAALKAALANQGRSKK